MSTPSAAMSPTVAYLIWAATLDALRNACAPQSLPVYPANCADTVKSVATCYHELIRYFHEATRRASWNWPGDGQDGMRVRELVYYVVSGENVPHNDWRSRQQDMMGYLTSGELPEGGAITIGFAEFMYHLCSVMEAAEQEVESRGRDKEVLRLLAVQEARAAVESALKLISILQVETSPLITDRLAMPQSQQLRVRRLSSHELAKVQREKLMLYQLVLNTI